MIIWDCRFVTSLHVYFAVFWAEGRAVGMSEAGVILVCA